MTDQLDKQKEEILMAKFNIEIVETLAKVIEVEAEDADSAKAKVIKRYKNEEIVLDSESILDVTFNKLKEEA